jgi:hypothetical protein
MIFGFPKIYTLFFYFVDKFSKTKNKHLIVRMLIFRVGIKVFQNKNRRVNEVIIRLYELPLA